MCAFTSVPFHPHFRVALSKAVHLRRHIDVDSFVRGDLDTFSRLALTGFPA